MMDVADNDLAVLDPGQLAASPRRVHQRAHPRGRNGQATGPADEELHASTVLIAAGDPRTRSRARQSLEGHGFEIVADAADAVGPSRSRPPCGQMSPC